jgi:arginine exporter protein ArgO
MKEGTEKILWAAGTAAISLIGFFALGVVL